LDLLGAWDYAVADPDGDLGSTSTAEKVGIMGVSMGGFIASTAFGMEPKVPGLWVDAAVFDLQSQVQFGIAAAAPIPGLSSLLGPLAMWFANSFAGVDIDLHNPAATLPQKKDSEVKRPVAVMQGLTEDLVYPAQS
jgi:alpha-beta hydrolase superfamily lysophospholipase